LPAPNPAITPSPRAGGVNYPDRAIQSIPRKSSPGTGDPIVTLTFYELIGENGHEILVGIDGNGGCVQYSRTDGSPPYLMALSAAPEQSEGFVEFLIGGTKTPVPSRYYLPTDAVHQIATYFQVTGERSPKNSWEEI